MNIAAVTPCSLMDFPDTLSCILFTQGCNFRCGYCHNPEMVLPQKDANPLIPWEAVRDFLEGRQGLLEGVVFCGGEPTLQSDLLDILQEVKEMGFKIKLDTNGSRPDILVHALEFVDYVAMDYKTIASKSDELYKGARYQPAIKKSLDILINGKTPYEVRTTVLKDYHTAETLRKMGEDLRGARKWYLQSFRPNITLDPSFSSAESYTRTELTEISEYLVGTCGVAVEVR